MDDNELREMDVKVHKALYPGWRIEKREWRHGIDYRAILPGDGPNTWEKDIPLPWYTTDLADWEPIYALKPEWMWDTIEFYGHTDTVLFYDVWREDPLPSIEVNVPWDDARGLAAYALGRARCVIAWAEAQHGG